MPFRLPSAMPTRPPRPSREWLRTSSRRLLSPWHGALVQSVRHFQLEGAIVGPLYTSRGFPHRCALFCLAMTLENHALTLHLAATVPSALPAFYADNWEFTNPCVHQALAATAVVDNFAAALGLGIDSTKTHHWSTDAPSKALLRRQGLQVRPHARELGVEVAYTKVPTRAGLLARVLATPTWSALKASLAPVSHKVQALRQVIWPRCLHAAEFNPPSETFLHRNRSAAARSVGYGLKGQNSWVVVNCILTGTADPGYFVLGTLLWLPFAGMLWNHGSNGSFMLGYPGDGKPPKGCLLPFSNFSSGWASVHSGAASSVP